MADILIDTHILNQVTRVGAAPPGFHALTSASLTEIVSRIVAGVQPLKIILFGSYADGTATDESDLDLLVVLETNARPAHRSLDVSRHLRPRPYPMDILVRTPGEIRAAVDSGDHFISDIITGGKVLYERPG